MTQDEYFASLSKLRKTYGNNAGLRWCAHRLQPLHDMYGETIGWKLVWVGKFESTSDFLRLKETWMEDGGNIVRKFFSYHYGPYESHWDLDIVKATKVTARIDAIDYGGGRGIHIHDGDKDRRIFQSDLKAPQLLDVTPEQFIEAVLKLRQARTCEEAFGLEFA